MKTIKDVENIYIVNKSKFITNLFYVENVDDVNNYINIIKNKYKDATHHCYAYIIDNIKRFNDDGEPTGTAGMPILNILDKNNLNYVLCIVTRYFGGIKLGAGGLLRAYSTSVTNAINNTKTLELISGYLINIKFNYNKSKDIDRLLNNHKIINKNFKNSIIYTIECDSELLNKLNELNIDIEIINSINIKR